MVKFAKLSKVDRINFAEELAKHIATINESVLSTSSVVTYKSGKAVVAKKVICMHCGQCVTRSMKHLILMLKHVCYGLKILICYGIIVMNYRSLICILKTIGLRFVILVNL